MAARRFCLSTTVKPSSIVMSAFGIAALYTYPAASKLSSAMASLFTVTPAISRPSTLGAKARLSSVSAITSAEYLPSRLAIVWLSPSMLSSTDFGKVTVSVCSLGTSGSLGKSGEFGVVMAA